MKLTNAVLSLFAAAALCLPVALASAQGNAPAATPAGGGGAAKPAAQPAATPPADAKPPAEGEKPKTDDKKDDKAAKEEPKLVYVNMKTSMGDIVIELNQEKAPITVKNFLSYVDKKHYDNTIFHRVISSFVIQGGGFGTDLKEKPTDKPIKNEWQNGLKNKRGTLSMARTMAPDSATSQFFINVQDNAALDQGGPRYGGAAYAVFGRVISGMDVVDKIRNVPTGTKPFANGMQMQDVPTTNVVIESVTRMSDDDVKKVTDKAGKPAEAEKK